MASGDRDSERDDRGRERKVCWINRAEAKDGDRGVSKCESESSKDMDRLFWDPKQ